VKSLYITATEPRSGKSAVAVGLYKLLSERLDKIAYLKPIGSGAGGEDDSDVDLVRQLFSLEATPHQICPIGMDEAHAMIAEARTDELLTRVLRAANAGCANCELLIIEGTDYSGSTSALEFEMNSDVSKTLDAPILMVASGMGKSTTAIIEQVKALKENYDDRGCDFVGVVVTKVDPELHERISATLEFEFGKAGITLLGVIPYDILLGKPRMSEVAQKLNAKVLFGSEFLSNLATSPRVAAMTIGNVLERIEEGMLLITPGDRDDMLLAAMVSRVSNTYPNIAGIILSGGYEPSTSVKRLIGGLSGFNIPVLQLPHDTYETTLAVNNMEVGLYPDDRQKIDSLYRSVRRYVNHNRLYSYLDVKRDAKTTPIVFLNGLLERARAAKKRIVMPEGDEERTLKAVSRVIQDGVAQIILLGDPKVIHDKAKRFDAKIDGATIINPADNELLEGYTEAYFKLREHKGITHDHAHDVMIDPIYFGTMMVQMGDADGLVSGAVHTTRHTITPAFQIIKTRPGISLVSSVFFMCLEDRVLVYGDCAVNPNPDAGQLAEIAVSSAETAAAFGFDPLIAMLSYSTGVSGVGPEVEEIAKATELVRQKAPHLKVEGPIQYDAAISLETAKTKLPDSLVAGHANIFIFPDLNAGNTAYKAVQRSAHAIAVGPVLQGLNKPVNDLSRGCLIEDIVYTIAITAIQAQSLN